MEKQKKVFLSKEELEILKYVKENISDFIDNTNLENLTGDLFDGYFIYDSDIDQYIKENNLTGFDMMDYLKDNSIYSNNKFEIATNYIKLKARNLIEKYIDFSDIDKNNIREVDFDKIINQFSSKNFSLKPEAYVQKIQKYRLNFKETKEFFEGLSRNNYENYIKAIISIENHIQSPEVLQIVYDKYICDDNMNLLSAEIENLVNEQNFLSFKNLKEKESKEVDDDFYL